MLLAETERALWRALMRINLGSSALSELPIFLREAEELGARYASDDPDHNWFSLQRGFIVPIKCPYLLSTGMIDSSQIVGLSDSQQQLDDLEEDPSQAHQITEPLSPFEGGHGQPHPLKLLRMKAKPVAAVDVQRDSVDILQSRRVPLSPEAFPESPFSPLPNNDDEVSQRVRRSPTISHPRSDICTDQPGGVLSLPPSLISTNARRNAFSLPQGISSIRQPRTVSNKGEDKEDLLESSCVDLEEDELEADSDRVEWRDGASTKPNRQVPMSQLSAATNTQASMAVSVDFAQTMTEHQHTESLSSTAETGTSSVCRSGRRMTEATVSEGDNECGDEGLGVESEEEDDNHVFGVDLGVSLEELTGDKLQARERQCGNGSTASSSGEVGNCQVEENSSQRIQRISQFQQSGEWREVI
jgi:hypothetical protein